MITSAIAGHRLVHVVVLAFSALASAFSTSLTQRSSKIATIPELPGGSVFSTSERISCFVTWSTTTPAPAPMPAPTTAEAIRAGGKIRPTMAPPTAPTAAPMPASWALSLTWILPSVSRLTRIRASILTIFSEASCLIWSQSASAAAASL